MSEARKAQIRTEALIRAIIRRIARPLAQHIVEGTENHRVIEWLKSPHLEAKLHDLVRSAEFLKQPPPPPPLRLVPRSEEIFEEMHCEVLEIEILFLPVPNLKVMYSRLERTGVKMDMYFRRLLEELFTPCKEAEARKINAVNFSSLEKITPREARARLRKEGLVCPPIDVFTSILALDIDLGKAKMISNPFIEAEVEGTACCPYLLLKDGAPPILSADMADAPMPEETWFIGLEG